jgi:hypothetical protein
VSLSRSRSLFFFFFFGYFMFVWFALLVISAEVVVGQTERNGGFDLELRSDVIEALQQKLYPVIVDQITEAVNTAPTVSGNHWDVRDYDLTVRLLSSFVVSFVHFMM